jgi:hypothetical protein
VSFGPSRLPARISIAELEMFSYQLQQRFLKLREGASPVFPSPVEIVCTLEPGCVFGGVEGSARMIERGSVRPIRFNRNNGAAFGTLNIAPVDVTVAYDNLTYTMQGDRLTVTTNCASAADLPQLLYNLQLALPALLAVEFPDAPFISRIAGRIGATEFGWELERIYLSFETTNTEDQERRLSQTIEDLSLLAQGNHRRLLAATYYFSVASRLLACGSGPWEFMAETILNWAKALSALFGTDSHNDMRAKLAKLDIPKDVVERYFVRVMILRNKFDVAHVSLGLHNSDDLQLMYKFLSDCEQQFRKLFRVALERLRAGKLVLPPYNENEATAYHSSMTAFFENLRAEADRNNAPPG